jgi:hypothetical protein
MKTPSQLILLSAGLALILNACATPPTPPPTASSAPVAVEPTAIPAATRIPTVAPTPLPYASLQRENDFLLQALAPRPSRELADNHIGVHFEDYERYGNTALVFENGLKWVRIQSLTEFWAPNRIDYKVFDLDSIPPYVFDTLAEYADNDVHVVLDLWMGAGLPPFETTFRDQAEVDRFSSFVRFVTSQLKGRVPYYEIWNEPGAVSVDDYANLVRAVVPIIREEDPQAKIIMGAIPGSWEEGYPGYGPHQRFHLDDEYLKELIRSGVAPMVDGISWHPFYGNIPSDPYYQDYPAILQGIKEEAASQGFTGEYFADEVLWTTVDEGEGFSGGPFVDFAIAVKRYLRAITLHRGLGINVTINTFFIEPDREWIPGDSLRPIHNLADTLAGAEPAGTTFSVSSEAPNVSRYAFLLPNGDQLVAAWMNDEAVEDDPGIDSTITIQGSSSRRAVGIDVLHGFEQELISSNDGENLVISDFLLKDYPIFIRLSR